MAKSPHRSFYCYALAPGDRSRAPAGLSLALGDRIRAVPLRRLFVPWAVVPAETPDGSKALARADVNGNWENGRQIFFGGAGCANCHTLRGEGKAFGPDLSNVIYRDRASVLRDIVEPSATINPDFSGSTVKLKDGTTLSGIVSTVTDEKVVIRLPGGVTSEQKKADVAAIEPMKISPMPEGFGQNLSKEQMEDLLTFLLTNPQPASGHP